jgi:FkbM family methyltransferase
MDYSQVYYNYLRASDITCSSENTTKLEYILSTTNWEDPQTGLDWNNYGVISLIEAANSQVLEEREIYLDMAISAFKQGISQHPLCHVHLTVIHTLLGEGNQAVRMGFNYLIGLKLIEHTPNSDGLLTGLIYLPPSLCPPKSNQTDLFGELMAVSDGYQQCSLFLGETLLRAQMVFYNEMGLRLLHLAAQLFPKRVSVNLQLGISSFMNGQREGLFYLHKAAQAAPDDFASAMALAIAYQDLQQPEQTQQWQEKAQANAGNCQPVISAQNFIDPDSLYSYVPYDGLWIAVQPSFDSIVTGVLVAEGDWFERELEFWRSQVKPGMVVIDVGANVGVYTFSAASRVGKAGRVVAIEPFSNCVERLQATCKLHQLSQVTICRGAASDHDGEIYLSLSTSSELNEVVEETSELAPDQYEKAPCFSLDSLCEREKITQVDFLKIDAEGHELSVLRGASQLIENYSPIILYENIASDQDSNLPVAGYLQEIGYELFRYQPFLQQLIPVKELDEFQGSLNLIAIKPK